MEFGRRMGAAATSVVGSLGFDPSTFLVRINRDEFRDSGESERDRAEAHRNAAFESPRIDGLEQLRTWQAGGDPRGIQKHEPRLLGGERNFESVVQFHDLTFEIAAPVTANSHSGS